MEWLFLLLVGGFLVALLWAYLRQRQPSATPPQNGINLASEAMTQGLLERADTLKQAYARVLEQKDGGIFRPESQLPASKEAIKAALLLCALVDVSRIKRKRDTATLHHYQVGYGCLAHFLTGEGRVKDSRWPTEVLAQIDPAQQDLHPQNPAQTIENAVIFPGFDSPSPVEFLRLCEEFARRFDALTDRELGQVEGLRIRTALLGA